MKTETSAVDINRSIGDFAYPEVHVRDAGTGLSERTIFHSWRIADRFLEFRFGKENGELSRITTSDIVGFLQHLTTRTPPLRDKPQGLVR